MWDPYDFTATAAFFRQYDIALTQLQYEQLAAYAAAMLEETQYQNITAIQSIEEIWLRHFLDAAYVVRFLPDSVHTVLDIGTGGGIPGLPLAILRPDLDIILLDSEERKLDFCERVAKTLQLPAKPLHGRAEELSKLPEYRQTFDCAISRAVANGSMLSELGLPFVRIGGIFCALKGEHYDPTVERFAEAAVALGGSMPEVAPYTLGGNAKHMILVHKVQDTPAQYPRRFAKMKRQPL